MKSLPLGLMLALVSFPAFAQSGVGTQDLLEDSEVATQVLSRCQGFWTWSADSMLAIGKPETSKFLQGYARGANIGALWLHATKFQSDHPSRQAKPLGDFKFLVEGPAEIESQRLAALQEMGDADEFKNELESMMELCQSTLPLVEQIGQMMRQQFVTEESED